MSLDMRLFFGFCISMMALMFARCALHVGFRFEIIVVCCAATVIIVLSIQNRIRRDWHWRGTNWKNFAGALVSLVLGVYFLGAVLPGTMITNPDIFPWLCGGGGVVTFVILGALNLVQQSEEGFAAHCGEQKIAEPAPTSPGVPPVPFWKRTLGTVLLLYFLAVWIASVGFFWKFNSAFRHGSPQPTATQTERLTNHGEMVYITREERHQVNLLQMAMMIGIPSIFVIGGIVRFVFGPKIFSRGEERPSR